jgi:hypothetical protein
MQIDKEFLQMALLGYQKMRETLRQRITEIQQQLGAGSGKARPAQYENPESRMSAAARKRIAAAQKKRWTEFRVAKNLLPATQD